MLITTPYRDLDLIAKKPPKIIAEVRKTYLSSSVMNFRAKLTADLLVKSSSEDKWCLCKVQVKGGQLQIFPSKDEKISFSSPIKLPLRHLSLQVDSITLCLSICKGQNIILSLKITEEKSFDRWVKTIAIELIRQTPLDAIKYLDILTFAEYWKKRDDHQLKPQSVNKQENNKKINKSSSVDVISTLNALNNNNPEEIVVTLMKKCQNVQTYVPVKEKLFLFESLCKMGRKIEVFEDFNHSSSLKMNILATKKTKSCYDLTSINKQVSVKEICKHFERTKEAPSGFNENNNNKSILTRTNHQLLLHKTKIY